MSKNTVGASAISCSYSTLTLFFRHQNRLADVMFGDESDEDEDATGAKKGYTFKNCDDDEEEEDEDGGSNSSENDNDSNC